jgi:hypothetical protein
MSHDELMKLIDEICTTGSVNTIHRRFIQGQWQNGFFQRLPFETTGMAAG